MSDAPKIEKIEPRSKEEFYSKFKQVLGLTEANLDDIYQKYLNNPHNKKTVFK